MHALIENGAVKQYPYSVGALKAAHPNTSFPAAMSDDALEAFNVFRVYFSTQPEYDAMTHALEEDVPVFDAEASRWTQVWRVRELAADEIAARFDAKAADVRAERNRLIAECDWTQLPDTPADKAAWAAYRQALRDVTAQPGFPWSVDWPSQP